MTRSGALAALVCCLAVSTAAAQAVDGPVVLVQPDGKTGVYLDTRTGKAINVRVIVVGGGTIDPGDGGDGGGDEPPKPPEPSDFSKVVQQKAEAIGDPDGAILLAGTYDLLADKLAEGKAGTTNDQRGLTIKGVTEDALGFLKQFLPEHHDEWLAFDIWLSGQTLPRVASRKLETDEQWAAFMREIATGLKDAAGDDGKAIDGSLAAEDALIGDELRPILRLLLRQLLDRLLERFFDRIGAVEPVRRPQPFAIPERRTVSFATRERGGRWTR